MNLAKAESLATKIVAELVEFCARITIAGSIRRRCEVVNDIDLVLIPKTGLKPIVDRVTKSWRQVAGEKGDAQNLRFMSPNDFQLDLFIAHGEVKDLVSTTPTNWGAVYLCRTGSRQHNVQLCQRAHAKGLKFAPYRGVVRKIKSIQAPGVFLDGDFGEEIIASKTEEDIYAALGLEWRDPKEREALKV
jgi:DNA polymerase (family 10)